MSDRFGAIASNEIKSRIPLYKVTPPPDDGKRLYPDKGGKPLRVYKKADSRAEIEEEIERLKKHYEPFFADYAPKRETFRRKTPLKTFLHRFETADDVGDFSAVLSGSGEWERVEIPHYTSAIGGVTEFYRTEFDYFRTEGKRTYIRFRGADYYARVFVNGNFAGEHEGFFAPFGFDVTDMLADGGNVLVVVLKNDYPYGGHNAPTTGERLEGDKMYAATGPGSDDPELGWHHCPPGMGIYQEVYLEETDPVFISDLFVRPDIDAGECEIWCEVFNSGYHPPKEVKLAFSLYGKNYRLTPREVVYTPVTFRETADGRTVTEYDLADAEKMKRAQKLEFFKGANLIRFRMGFDGYRLWEPESPYLSEASAVLTVDGRTADTAAVTFGMRKFSQGEYGGKRGMFFLNNKSVRLRGANTMGFEQQDVMRGDGEQLLYDMLMAKAANMNFLRITQRPVQSEVYDLCDRIGLMIQTDLPLFTNVRRTKFAEVVRQSEEMERLIRSHACAVVSTYINEPFANASGRPHRHFIREELELLFAACDSAVRMQNPDRVIKHIDGDYDPPSDDLPDYHTYTMWYNGHGIEMGRVYRGYWLDLPKNSFCGCGEFGAEGLDPAPLMRRRYPAEWLPDENEADWTPSRIKDAQSGNMYPFFFDRQDTLEEWAAASREYQSFAVRLQTEAFRRNPLMVTFAVHLFIDAWPAGWMKATVDCEREPKPAFYAYKDALTPLMVSLRTDRKTFFAGERAEIEAWICNDTHRASAGDILRCEVTDASGKMLFSGDFPAVFGENSAFRQGKISFDIPETDVRTSLNVRCILTDAEGTVIHYNDETIGVFPYESVKTGGSVFVAGEEYLKRKTELDAFAKRGGTVVISMLEPGEYDIADSRVSVKACGMRPLNFVSRKTGHPLISGFLPGDFGYWYDDRADMMTPIISSTLVCDDFTPVLWSGNCKVGSAWQNPVFRVPACAEKKYGKGRVVVNQVDLDSHLKNPVAVIFRNRLADFR